MRPCTTQTPQVITSGDYHVLDVPISEPLAQRLGTIAKDYNLILIDTDSVDAPELPGTAHPRSKKKRRRR